MGEEAKRRICRFTKAPASCSSRCMRACLLVSLLAQPARTTKRCMHGCGRNDFVSCESRRDGCDPCLSLLLYGGRIQSSCRFDPEGLDWRWYGMVLDGNAGTKCVEHLLLRMQGSVRFRLAGVAVVFWSAVRRANERQWLAVGLEGWHSHGVHTICKGMLVL